MAVNQGHDNGGEIKESNLNEQMTTVGIAKTSLDNDLESRSGNATSSAIDTEKAFRSIQAPADPNIVDWDGTDDPKNPLNWSKPVRLGQVALVSLITLIAYVYSPLNQRQANRPMTETWPAPYVPLEPL